MKTEEEHIFLVAASIDNGGIFFTPICSFDDQGDAQTYFEACEEYDEMSFHHVIKMKHNPSYDYKDPYAVGDNSYVNS